MMRYPMNGVPSGKSCREVAMETFFGLLWLVTLWIAWRGGFVAGVDAALDNRLP
jgi:hypothetical protein